MSKANFYRLDIINQIIEEYQSDGYTLTLRQLYYQLVSRDIIPNKQSEYAKLSTVLKEGRMAGIVDWSAIEDRLRKPSSPASFDSPENILQAAIQQYELPRQKGQDIYLEVFVEKDALSGVLKRITEKYHVPISVNRGYASASSMFDAYQRFSSAIEHGQSVKVLYLGDYDPSGIDMIRDIRDRIAEFAMGEYGYYSIEEALVEFNFFIEPIALTREQIKKFKPPPNPAKVTDPRAKEFIRNHGSKSWEVDALRPDVLSRLLDDAIRSNIDEDVFNEVIEREESDKVKLKSLMSYL